MTKVKDILAKKGPRVDSITRGESVLEAAKHMNERRIGSLVLTEGNRVVGILTERDILTRVVAAQRDPAATTIEDVMTSPVACCRPDTTIDECRGVMRDKRIRHLPVVDEGQLCGLITIGDLNACDISEQQRTIEYLHEYIYGPSASQ